MTNPSILDVIGARVDLRRAGHEWVGRCPFHDDRHPSLYVNTEKQVFLCRSCGVGGKVFKFIMMIDGLTFSQAKAALGVKSEPRPKPTASRKRAAELAAAWANEQRAKINVMIAETMDYRDFADEIDKFEIAEIFDRELIILREFYDALKYPRGIAELLALREAVESITAGAEVSL